MADELEQQEEQEKKKKSGMGLPMIIGIIVGFLVLQVAAIYLIFTVFLKPANSTPEKDKKHTEKKEGEDEDAATSHKLRYIVPVKCGEKEDIIINPRGSSTRYVVIGVGLEVDDEEKGKELEKIMIPICDRITSTFSAQSLEELEDTSKRDSLRIILKKQIQPFMGEMKLRNVYFSRFLIQ